MTLLQSILGASVSGLTVPRGAALDDVYDAAVLAWTAARVVYGFARRVPETAVCDARGLRMEIVY